MKRERPVIQVNGEDLARETNPYLRKVNRRLRKANAKATKEDHAFIVQTFLAAITGKAFLKGETIEDLVNKHCPDLYEMARDRGLVFSLDIRDPGTRLPLNTHEALSSARVFYECVPAVRH